MVQVSAFHGPLPPPETLEKYQRILPGSAERILQMAEREQAHRHRLEAEFVRISRRGQLFAFFLGLIGLAGGLALVWKGKSVTGLTTFLTILASLTGVYLYERRYARTPLAPPARAGV